ncbi:MAG: cyclic nucleotide-gated ion channel [Pseudomonadota bacterium]
MRYSWYYNLRLQAYHILETGHEGLGRWVNRFLILLIILNVIAFAIDTVPDLHERYRFYFDAFNVISVLIFTIEYILRLWSCVEIPLYDGNSPWQSRWRFARTAPLVIDILAILPFYLSFLFPMDLRALRVLRLFRFFKLVRYSAALQSLMRVMQNELHALLGALLIMAALLLFAASGIYFIERSVQPEHFGSIPDAMWWAIATLTTVGYGDVTPVTVLGKLFAGLVMIFGLGMFALPIAIISTGFSQETTKREFVVTWTMVAQVPIFKGLDAAEISEIISLLESHSIQKGGFVFRTGEEAQAMYFIVSGDIEVRYDDKTYLLTKGDYFGELAILQKRKHLADAVALSRCSLLVLSLEELNYLFSKLQVKTTDF